jgi:hypothetical protein
MERPKRRTLTSPGLGGVSELRVKVADAPVSGLRARQGESSEVEPVALDLAPPVSEFFPVSQPPASQPPASQPAPSSERTSRRPRGSRRPVRVDDFGEAAVAIAANAVRASAPKIVSTREELGAAPLDHRDAFVLSLIDGMTSVQGLIDLAGMPEQDFNAILERLVRLGIVSLL